MKANLLDAVQRLLHEKVSAKILIQVI